MSQEGSVTLTEPEGALLAAASIRPFVDFPQVWTELGRRSVPTLARLSLACCFNPESTDRGVQKAAHDRVRPDARSLENYLILQ